jgi:hypothetical protein
MNNPPHSYKAEIVAAHAKDYRVLIETGTYNGDMVSAQIGNFDLIYSIELSEQLFLKAKQKFMHNKNINILFGDSPKVLAELVPLLTLPSLFWLDAHFSGGNTVMSDTPCPLLDELDVILGSPLDHMILIDDARCFGVNQGFPTMRQIEDRLCNFTILNDIIWKI